MAEESEITILRGIPFSAAEIKSMNEFQRYSAFNKVRCGCGYKMYAREDGWFCPDCYAIIGICATFISSGSWKLFKSKEEE
jgi:hypothetical protein